MARPQLEPDEQQTEVISLKVSPSMLAAIEGLAKRQGYTKAQILRAIVVAGMRALTPKDEVPAALEKKRVAKTGPEAAARRVRDEDVSSAMKRQHEALHPEAGPVLDTLLKTHRHKPGPVVEEKFELGQRVTRNRCEGCDVLLPWRPAR